MHDGIALVGDLTSAHGWTGSVATIEVVAMDSPAAPSTGFAGLLQESSGGSISLTILAGGLIVLLAGTTLVAARRVANRA